MLALVGSQMCPLIAPIAWMMANKDLKAIDAGEMDPKGRKITRAGKIAAIILCVWCVVSLSTLFTVMWALGRFDELFAS